MFSQIDMQVKIPSMERYKQIVPLVLKDWKQKLEQYLITNVW